MKNINRKPTNSKKILFLPKWIRLNFFFLIAITILTGTFLYFIVPVSVLAEHKDKPVSSSQAIIFSQSNNERVFADPTDRNSKANIQSGLVTPGISPFASDQSVNNDNSSVAGGNNSSFQNPNLLGVEQEKGVQNPEETAMPQDIYSEINRLLIEDVNDTVQDLPSEEPAVAGEENDLKKESSKSIKEDSEVSGASQLSRRSSVNAARPDKSYLKELVGMFSFSSPESNQYEEKGLDPVTTKNLIYLSLMIGFLGIVMVVSDVRRVKVLAYRISSFIGIM